MRPKPNLEAALWPQGPPAGSIDCFTRPHRLQHVLDNGMDLYVVRSPTLLIAGADIVFVLQELPLLGHQHAISRLCIAFLARNHPYMHPNIEVAGCNLSQITSLAPRTPQSLHHRHEAQ